MPWVVDTCNLIDVLEDDPTFGQQSAQALDVHRAFGLVICPLTYVELAPAFSGDRGLQESFLAGIGIDFRSPWTWRDTREAHVAWHGHIHRRRQGHGAKRPLADLLIGAFALRFDGLITRNPADFRTAFPDLTVVDATKHAPSSDH